MPATGGSLGNAGAVATAPQYQTGSRGPEVSGIQQLLGVWGFSVGAIDGQYGPATANAIRAFQKYLGLPQTGVADGTTIQHLQSQNLLTGVREGLVVPGQPLPEHMQLDGQPTVNADIVSKLAGSQPQTPTTTPAPQGPTSAPRSGGGPAPAAAATTTPPPAKPKTTAEIEEEVRRKYGSYAWMLNDPGFAEIRSILMQGAQEGWDDQTLNAKLQGTQYFQTHDSNVRSFETRTHTDGATLNSEIETNRQKIEAMAQKMGVNIEPNRLLQIATDSVKYKWTTDFQFTSALAAEAKYRPDYGGDIGSYETKAKGIARDYLMPIDDETAFNWARDLAAGKIDENTITSHFTNAAKGLLGPDYDAQIDAGLKPRDLLSSQINTIGNLMEISTDDVDLVNDPRWQKVLQYTDPNTGKRRPMTVSETSLAVKSTDDWWKTNNANKEVGEKASYLAKIFGKSV